jgi:hypothetical protein
VSAVPSAIFVDVDGLIKPMRRVDGLTTRPERPRIYVLTFKVLGDDDVVLNFVSEADRDDYLFRLDATGGLAGFDRVEQSTESA